MTRTRTRLPPGAVLVLATSLVACTRFIPKSRMEPAAVPAASPDDDAREPPPTAPLALARDDDYVVRVVAGNVTCTGTLIDEDRVLTAHHCVSQRDKYGDMIDKDVEPNIVRVELGGDYLPWGEVGVRAIVAPPCGYKGTGQGDIAILVLEHKLVGVATISPALDHAPSDGEVIEPVGFGHCASSSDGIRRKERIGGRIEAVESSRFRVEASICPGDSGGPALDRKRGEVVGVISLSAMDDSEQTVGRSLFTRLDHWRPLFSNAKLIAEGTSAAELPPVAGCE